MPIMRWVFLLAGLTAAALQAGCGPAPPVEPQMAPDDATVMPPGLPQSGTGSGAEQRYYNYN